MLPKIDQAVNFSSGSKERTVSPLDPTEESNSKLKNGNVTRLFRGSCNYTLFLIHGIPNKKSISSKKLQKWKERSV
jgi:hypothetical protein